MRSRLTNLMKTSRMWAMFAVIETGGKQYLVGKDQKVKVEKLPYKVGESFAFDKVLLLADGDSAVTLGTPYLEKAKVEALVVRHARAPKITHLRYHNKTRRRRKHGHKQPFTEVEIKSIKK